MNKNVGYLDRIIRMSIAGLLVLGILSNNIIGTWEYVAGIIAIIMGTSSLFGSSPIYNALNISTAKK